MHGVLQLASLTCILLLAHPATRDAQAQPEHIPLVQLPVIAPTSYPRLAPLAEVNGWLWDEFARIAHARDRGPLPAPPRWHGGSCHTYCIFPTSEALPISEWQLLSRRATEEMSFPDVESRRAAIGIAHTLLQIACLGDPNVRGLSSTELLHALADRLRDADAKIRGHAAGLIAGNVGVLNREQTTHNFDPIPVLLAAINDPDSGTRAQIVMSLQTLGYGDGTPGSKRYGPHGDAVVQALVTLADDPDRMTRIVAIHSIGLAGPSAAPAVPRLIEWLESPDRIKRRSAARALAELGPLAAPAVPALSAMLHSTDLGDRYAALHTLRRMGPAAASAVPAIAERLKDPDLSTTDLATCALSHIGPSAKSAIPQLRELALRSDDQYQREINRAIAVIEGRRSLDDWPPLIAPTDSN